MNRFTLSDQLQSSRLVVKEEFLKDLCRGKTVLDLGCVRHSAEFAVKDPKWLHKHICATAAAVVGVDFLPAEIIKLRNLGFNVRVGDVTKPLNLGASFDIILACDLIEHLSNFEGFFENCIKHLNPGGKLIISTANPFYIDEYIYILFKGRYLVNPEHTCWIDPLLLAQLCERFGFRIAEIHFQRDSWCLAPLICETSKSSYDILNNRWLNDSRLRQYLRKIAGLLFGPPYRLFKWLIIRNAPLLLHSDYIAIIELADGKRL